MNRTKEELLTAMADAVVGYDQDAVVRDAEEYVSAGYPAAEGINDGLATGMDRVGELYENGEYYIAHLLTCSDTMNRGIDVLMKNIEKTSESEKLGTIVIGVVNGDVHDIGKNLVKIMFEAAGFRVYDLGKNVTAEEFVNAAVEYDADIIAMSALMSVVLSEMKAVREEVDRRGLSDRIKLMVGGGTVSRSFAESINAGYSENAVEAVRLAKELINK